VATLDLEGFQACTEGQGACVFLPSTSQTFDRCPRGKVAAGSGLRAISWRRPDRASGQGKAKWPRLIEQALERLARAADAPSSAPGRALFPEATVLPGRARDGRGRDQRQRRVRSEARANTANVLAVILGWTDLVSGIVAAKPRAGRTEWEHKSWDDVGRVAFGSKDVPGELCVGKRTARAVARLAGLGFLEVTQIRERQGEEWRSRIAVKRVTQLFWAKLGLLREFYDLLKARKQEQKARRAAAKEASDHAGERARQRGDLSPVKVAAARSPRAQAPEIGPAPPGSRALPECVIELARKLAEEL
jgi:hypothetical protein